MKPITITALALVTLALLVPGTRPGSAATARARAPHAAQSWLVLASSRDGRDRAYSMRRDGSRLTPLLRTRSALEPIDVSADGRSVLYGEGEYGGALYVSRADGTRLHRVARGISSAVLSPDGRTIAGTDGRGIVVMGADGRGRRHLGRGLNPRWSPDGKALVFERLGKCGVEVQPLHGRARVLVPGVCDGAPSWSPSGRWIAYERGGRSTSLWVVRPNGKGRRRLARTGNEEHFAYAWSPDGRTLAYVDFASVSVVGLATAARHLRLDITPAAETGRVLQWSPDGRSLVASAHEGDDPDQIWIVGRDGRGLHRLTKAGANVPVGWSRLRPVLRPAAPIAATEQVLGATTVATAKPLEQMSADGDRVAFAAGSSATDCQHVDLWSPAAKTLVRVSQRLPAPCSFRDAGLVDYAVYELALAGSRVAWSEIVGCGNYCDVQLMGATLPASKPVSLMWDSGGGGAGGGELLAFNPHGHGDLLVFNDGDSLVRVDATCLAAVRCKPLRTGAHSSAVESVSNGLIAVREPRTAAVLDEHGTLVTTLEFGPNELRAVRLDGDKLVVARAGVLEVYDARTGAAILQRTLPAGFSLSDVDGGVAVLRHGREILLLRLADGHTQSLTPARGPVLADLEGPGLYYSYATTAGQGRLVFVPRAGLERQLDGDVR